MTNIAIENDHLGWIYPLYGDFPASLPEGIWTIDIHQCPRDSSMNSMLLNKPDWPCQPMKSQNIIIWGAKPKPGQLACSAHKDILTHTLTFMIAR